ncbi:MAG: phospholipase D-like domain-containing protein, partial [Brachymonas sp.]
MLVMGIVTAWLLFPLPSITDRQLSTAIAPSDETELGRWMLDKIREHPGQSGVIPLANGHDALASRIALIDAAQQSVDVQYYIWHDDITGTLLLKALHNAAQRGVRVRLLLDDNGIHDMDDLVAALDAQLNIEVRLFNPSTIRHPKILGYAINFFRMNRRMHNKSLTVDGAVTIVGG